MTDKTVARMTPDERKAAYVEGCQRVGPKIYRQPNLVTGPRSGAVFLGSTLPVVPVVEPAFAAAWDYLAQVSADGRRSFSVGFRNTLGTVVVPPGTLVEVTRS